MATITLCRFPIPEAESLAHLTGVLYDIESAIALLDRLAIPVRSDPRGQEDRDALWTAAIVRYARAFSGGIRQWGRDDYLATLDEQDLAAHNYVMLVRDKFVAHSVNDMEQSMPTVAIRDDGTGTLTVGGVTPSHTRTVAFSEPFRLGMRDLASQCKAWVDRRSKEEGDRLTEIASKMNPAQLLANGMNRLSGGSGAPGVPRKFR